GTYNGGYTLGGGSPLFGDANASVALNGSTGYVSVPDSAAFALPSQVTVEGWWDPTATPHSASIFNRRTAPGNGGGNSPQPGGGAVPWYVYPTAWQPLGSGFPPALNRWHHLVGSYQSTLQQLWIDGQLAAQSTTVTGAINTPAGPNIEMGRNIANTSLYLSG